VYVHVAVSRVRESSVPSDKNRTASESYASVCSFVLCDSSTFLKFWLEDKCRDTFLSHLPRADLASLRLACHDFSVRAAPALFSHLNITFKARTFTKPARLAALDRLGFYVKTLDFRLPHSSETFLPPLVDPETGAELSFTYTPQVEASTMKKPKYGDLGTTEILTRQWPTLFHAATNVPAFIRAFSSFVNLSHLKISCPKYDKAQRFRRSTVDFALISLRIAVERTCLNALDTLTLSPIHPSGMLYLSPLLGYGATPRSASRWSRISNLTICAENLPPRRAEGEPDYFTLLQTYLRNFQSNLTHFTFRWAGSKGEMPVARPVMSSSSSSAHSQHPLHRQGGLANQQPLHQRRALPSMHFPKLRNVEFENVRATSAQVNAFVETHKSTISEVNFEDFELSSGNWEHALAPLTRVIKSPVCGSDVAEIPIMLSPRTGAPLPSPMERVEFAQHEANGRKSLRMSRWLSSKNKGRTPVAARSRVRDGLLGCEEQLKKVLRGGVFQWR
jgi:hypothetical protein